LMERMKSYRFDIMGSTRTIWDFHVGFGLMISADLLLQAVVLWHLGTMAKRDPGQVRPLIAMFALAFVANAILVGRFFFVVPLIMAIAIAICLGLAWLSAGANKAA